MSSELMVYDPGLPSTPGWAGMSEAKRTWLQEKTSNIKRFGAMEGLASANGAVELWEVKTGLDGESMSITDYMRTIYGADERTGWRKLANIEAMLEAGWSVPVIRTIAEKGALLLRGTAGVHLKDLVNVAKELPAPKERDEKTIEAFIETKVRNKLKEHRSARRSGEPIRLTHDDAAKMAFNTVNRVLRSCRLRTSAQKETWLRTVFGWTMEAHAIPGTLRVHRISIPEGVLAKVGRPRKVGQEL